MGKRIKLLALIVVSFVVGTATWNMVAVSWLHAHHPVPGEFHVIDGRTMHLYCTGQGSPTVILEAGSGDTTFYWQTIQPGLSKLTRTCSYDRSGLGWSAPRSGPQDARTIAQHLHALLDSANIPRPIILVGASAGGFYVREYAREYPKEIIGVALLDSSSPRQLDELPGSREWYDAGRKSRPQQAMWEKVRVWTGWQRLRGQCHDTPDPGLEYLAADLDAMMCRPIYAGGDLSEWMQFETSGQQADQLKSFGDVPLLIMSQDPDRPKPGWSQQAIAAQPIWSHEQEALKLLSAKSWRVVAKDSGHHVHQDRPTLVVTQIGKLLDYIRSGSPPRFGSTVVE